MTQLWSGQKLTFALRTSFKCAMMFKNLTDLPLKVLDIIPDLIAHEPNPKVKAELEAKEINFQVRSPIHSTQFQNFSFDSSKIQVRKSDMNHKFTQLFDST